MTGSAKDVQAFFERVATDWDTMRLAYYDERVIEKMAEVASVGEGSEIADVGTGNRLRRRRSRPASQASNRHRQRCKYATGSLREHRCPGRIQRRAVNW